MNNPLGSPRTIYIFDTFTLGSYPLILKEVFERDLPRTLVLPDRIISLVKDPFNPKRLREKFLISILDKYSKKHDEDLKIEYHDFGSTNTSELEGIISWIESKEGEDDYNPSEEKYCLVTANALALKRIEDETQYAHCEFIDLEQDLLDAEERQGCEIINLSGDFLLDEIYDYQTYPIEDIPEIKDRHNFQNKFYLFKGISTRKNTCLVKVVDNNVKVLQNKTRLYSISPRNIEQEIAFHMLTSHEVKLVSLLGVAGGGKTLCAIAAGIEQMKSKIYDKIIIARPMVSVGKEIGFLPGSAFEKMDPWLQPIKDNIATLSANMKGFSYEQAIAKKQIEIQPLSMIRGRNIEDAFVIIDEAQNLSLHELKTIITRIGKHSKIVLTGDLEQIDLDPYYGQVSGLETVVKRFLPYSIAGHISMDKVERSEIAEVAGKIL